MAGEIYDCKMKINVISDILLKKTVIDDDADLLHFVHLAIRNLPKCYRDRLFSETVYLLKARRKELYGMCELLIDEYKKITDR